VESILDPHVTAANNWPTVPAPADCEDGEFGGMKNGREPNLLDEIRARTGAAAVGNQRLTA
jgi:hypothetical protein